MKKVTDENEIPLFAETGKKQGESWRKSIPAQVFLNYFFAINYHLKNNEAEVGIQHLAYLNQNQTKLQPEDLPAIGRLLQTCWSTEYALRTTAKLGDETYLRNALH
ncbi:MAG TPA: hypothetical protein VK927_02945, partial [Adhaeribacter sp.]|nr:hypothetical protein [Adhaeribacter sp.]